MREKIKDIKMGVADKSKAPTVYSGGEVVEDISRQRGYVDKKTGTFKKIPKVKIYGDQKDVI